MTRSTGIRDPLPVEGAGVAYGDIETALGHAISTAAVPWADAHRAQRPDGWQLTVELVRAEASYEAHRLHIVLDARATLRTRGALTYLGQTQVSCHQAGAVPPDKGAPILFSCMERLGRDLGGWLGRIQP